METNEDEPIARKPPKQRRTSQVTVRPCLSQAEGSHPQSSILQDLLGVSPQEIRLYGKRQSSVRHAIGCFQTMLDNLKKRKANEQSAKLDPSQWKEIHGFLILQLGSIDHPNSSSDPNRQIALVTSVCHCLSEVYHESLPCGIYSNGELKVAFATIADHFGYMCSMKSNNDESLDENSMESITPPLELLRMVLKYHDVEPNVVEKITKLLVGLHCDYLAGKESRLKQSAEDFLRDLSASKDPVVAHTANISRSVIRTLHDDSSHGRFIDPDSSDAYQMESLQYLGCMSYSRHGANELSRSLHLLDALVKWAIQPAKKESYSADFCCKAATYLSAIAIHRSTPGEESEPDWIMDALLRVLTGTSDLNVKSCVIPGLRRCRPEKVTWENAGFLQKVLSCLSMVVTFQSRPAGNHNDDNRHTAAKILFEILEPTMSMQSSTTSALSFTNAMAYINMFLKMEDHPHLQYLAVTTLIRANSPNAARVALLCPSVLNNLGKLACSSSASQEMKQRSVEFFAAVTRSDQKAASILARQPNVLEALVAVLAAPYDAIQVDNSRRDRQVALLVLTRLSRDVCNRRILAKHVGVLASMIRYARTMSNNPVVTLENNSETNITLADLKQIIMDLAVAI